MRDAYVPELPPIVDAPAYLVVILMRLGPTVPVGMGSGPIDDMRIRAWQDNNGIALQPWETGFLIRLSKEYAAEAQKATENFYPPPWWPEDEPRPPTKDEVEAERQRRM